MGSFTFRSLLVLSALVICPETRVAFAQDPRPEFTHLRLGEQAPFDGYLLTPAAVASVITADERARLQCEADAELRLREAKAGFDLKLGEAAARERALEATLSSCAEARKEETDKLRAEIDRQRMRAKLTTAGSFVVGALTATLVAAAMSGS